jgi:hypothetical protein
MKNLTLILAMFSLVLNLSAQTTVFYQGFENRGINCTENWGYLGGARNTDNVKGGSYSNRVGRAGESNTIQFNTVDISGMSNLTLKVHHSVVSASGAGLDDFEGAIILVSLDGALFVPVGRISGKADYGYTYNTALAGIAGTSPCSTFTAVNPLNYSVPAGVNTLSVRIMSVTGINCKTFNNNMNTGIASNYNGADEGFYVDEISLVSTDPNVRSIWKGTANTNWFDCRNWHNNLIPTAQTSVIIDETAVNRCVIGTSAGNAAFCKELTVSSSNAVNNSLTIQNNSSLTVSQSVFISKTAGSTPVTVEMLSGSTLNCSALTLSGTSNGAENAVLKIEDFMSRVNIAGDFRNNAGGSLDMSNGTTTSGVLEISGNWYSNGLESDFKEEGSNVIFTGANAQSINTNGFTEIFHNLSLEKTSRELTLMANIDLDNSGVLNLNDDYLVLNGKLLALQNSSAAAIRQNATGAIVSETTDNMSRLSWNIGTDSDVHEFPFANSVNGEYIPFSYTVNSGDAGLVTLSTYGTSVENLPLPNGPLSTVTNLGNPNNSDATADRFWHIDVAGSAEATMTFTYAANELPVAPYDDANSMVAQRYESSDNQWQQPLPGQNASAYTVTVSGVSTFGTWALSNQSSILPVEMLFFKGEIVGQTVELDWATESENNTEVFVVERSANAVDFETIGEVAAVGFSTLRNDYDFTDSKPNEGFNYYRIRILDFDNTSTYSNVIALNIEKAAAVNVYPNPLMAERRVNIEAPFAIQKLNVVNALGQTVMQLENPENSIQLPSEWSAGVYYMVFETAGKSVVNKIMIQQ